MKEKEIKSVCPYTCNWDCICRAGLDCGGYKIDSTHYPTQCPFYKPLNIRALDDIITKLMNECEGCPRNRSNGGNCNFAKGHCKKLTTIQSLNDLKDRYKREERKYK